ncbi:MAG: glycosyltransferase 87 family protein, partial [Micrococcales bacterium]|nr:glycosyltransferase 87 family protein [Micrococcales bacterium]
MGLLVLFMAVHLYLLFIDLGPEQSAATDVGLYDYWMTNARQMGSWPVRDFSWVYPCAALIPMAVTDLIARVTSLSFMTSWHLMVTGLNGLACLAMWRLGKGRKAAIGIAFWMAYLALLGPTALTRVDSVAAPLIIVGLAAAARHPRVASVALTLGAWVKVAPGAAVVPLFALVKDRLRSVLVPAAATCVGVIGGAMALGASPGRVLGFFFQQAGRGLQVEAVAATPFLIVRSFSRNSDFIAEFNNELGTHEVTGVAPMAVARTTDVLLVIVTVLIGLFAWRARNRPRQALPVAALAALTAMIVTNKVGSPQFLAWIGPPVAVALISYSRSRWWRVIAAGTGLLAFLTHLIYPAIYFPFLEGNFLAVMVVVTRNTGLVVLLVLCLVKLWRMGTAPLWPRRPDPPPPTPARPPT